MKSGLGWVVLLASLLAAACGDDDGAPPGVIATGNDDKDKDSDGGTGEDSDIPPLPTIDGGGGDDDPIRIDASKDDVEAVPIQPGPDAGDNVDVAGPAPEEWTCDETLWAERDSTGDYNCDCGCGAVDFADCLATSCADAECSAPGCDVCRTDDGQYLACDAPGPGDWQCSAQAMGDTLCDCGCGAHDPTCAGDGCLEPGCFTLACDLTHDRIGDPMPTRTNAWLCSPDRFGDGVCDCGCGEADSDCFDMGCPAEGCNMPACELCHADGDYVVPCADTSDDWNWGTCRAFRFGSGDGCDEDCGATDPDCLGSAQTDDTRRCWDTNSLRGCEVPLAGSDPDMKWLCDPEHFGTGDGCDCGCGAPDPDCDGGGCQSGDCSGSDSCDYCHDGSYEPPPGDPLDWVACGGWDTDRCPASALGDGTCDCGCGDLDPDCRDQGRTGCSGAGCEGGTCEQCWDSDGNASTDCATWTCDAELARDGVCDCGCGASDPDCDGGEGCSDKGCRARGCDLCHTGDTGDILQTCGDWHCDWAAYDDGETCDCGCGAPDPDCGNGTGRGCIVPGCRDIKGNPRADECEVCHDHLGRPIVCAPK